MKCSECNSRISRERLEIIPHTLVCSKQCSHDRQKRKRRENERRRRQEMRESE